MTKTKLTLAALCFLLWFAAGCATMSANHGSIVLDPAAERDFATFRLDPNMNYYYSGPDYYPNALMGLKKEYVLDNDLWKPLEPNPALFRDKIRSMQDAARLHGTFQHGFAIKDPQGKTIGVWYSILQVKTMVVTMGEENKVMVYTPELDIYQVQRDGHIRGKGRKH